MSQAKPVKAVKREGYFSRVRKSLHHQNVVQIDETHQKYIFTQLVREGLKQTLERSHCECASPEDVSPVKDVLKVNFTSQSNSIPVEFSSFASHVFCKFREKVGLSRADYMRAISPITSDEYYLEFLSNSKSGQTFFLTNDKQFVLKTVTRSEAHFFLHILTKYMDHFQKYPHSMLVKLIGVHRVRVKKFQKPVYFIVMMSVFYPDERIERRYDIKGCLIGRYTQPGPEDDNTVVILKEKNLDESKLHLGPQREWFLKQLEADTRFLQEIQVLDYSLLAATQPLHMDEKHANRTLASIVERASKSTSKHHSLHNRFRNFSRLTDEDQVHNLPGMISEEEAAPSSAHHSLTNSDWDKSTPCTSTSADTDDATDADSGTPRSVASCGESSEQNRRLLPDHRNELHVLDGVDDRYFVGIIDFFTRYTIKKRLEHAYKSLIHPPLSFSTVPPDVFAERFRKYWRDHTD